jgi:hypothetical protein
MKRKKRRRRKAKSRRSKLRRGLSPRRCSSRPCCDPIALNLLPRNWLCCEMCCKKVKANARTTRFCVCRCTRWLYGRGQREVSLLMNTVSNIEAVSRALCERELQAAGISADQMPKAIDRYWHCVAAEIEAGLVDCEGRRLSPFDFNSSQEAYRDWCTRHRGRTSQS